MTRLSWQRTPFLERLFAGHHDILAALRSLRRSPGFVAAAVLSLGLAIGLNTTTFAMLDAIRNPYLPFEKPTELLTVRPVGWAARDRVVVARDMYLEMRDRTDLYQAVVPWSVAYTTVEANRYLTSGYVATVGSELFRTLGVEPIAGRAFDVAADEANAGDPVVIADRLWEAEFASRTDLRGLTLTIDGRTHPVIGVMPSSMQYPADNTVAWLAMPRSVEQSATLAALPAALVRIHANDNVGRVRAELTALSTRIALDLGQDHKLFRYNVTPLQTGSRQVDRLHESLGGASMLILIVACLNLANLMLARGLGRRRELAVRKAVGASGAALMRFVLTEAAVLAIAGGLWGVMLSLWGVNLAHYRMPERLLQLGFIAPRVSWRVVAFGVGITAITVFVAGIAPALQARRADPNDAMKDGGANTARRNRVYPALAIGQVALALIVLMGAGLLLRSAHAYSDRHFSGDAVHLLYADARPDSGICSDPVRARRVMSDFAASAAATPGVRYAATFAGLSAMHSVASSDLPGEVRQMAVRGYVATTPDYLRTLGVGIAEGRDFVAGDLESPGVVIVNQETAKKFWKNVPPVGRMMKLGPKNSALPWLRVIGVTMVSPDTLNGTVIDPAPDISVVGGSRCARGLTIFVRTIDEDPQIPIDVYHSLRAAVPVGFVSAVTPALGGFNEGLKVELFLGLLFTALGAFGLALAAFGVYGVLSYVVSRRMREFAMRLALGAQRGDLRRIVLHDALVIVLAGTGIGAWGAMWGGHFLSRGYYLYNIGFSDVLALVGAEAALMAITLASCIGPIRRAARADPVDLLRST